MSNAWSLEKFGDCLDQWIEQENPARELRLVVTQWLFTRFDDPYQGVRREDNFDNLWYGSVPFSRHGDFQAVMCSYWIIEREHKVVCESIATLSLPH